MIEIIEKLVPLLEGAGNGAFWVITMYFSVVIFKILIISLTVLSGVWMGLTTVRMLVERGQQLELSRERSVNLLRELYLRATTLNHSGWVMESDLREVRKWLAKEGFYK